LILSENETLMLLSFLFDQTGHPQAGKLFRPAAALTPENISRFDPLEKSFNRMS